MLYDLHAFVLYSLRTALCLALFYLFFKWVLSRDTLHRLNRVVLLTAVVVAFLLPVCRVTIVEVVPAPEPIVMMEELPAEEIVTTLPDDGIAWQQVVGALCLLAMAVMVGRMVVATYSVWRTIHRLKRSAEEVREVEGATVIVASEELSPFSWGRYIVLSARDAAENGEAILSHELAHIRLGHTWDLVLFDLLMVGQWFNPAMWLLRRELRAIHEYEADRAVIALGVDPRSYQLLLIKKAVGERWCSVANSLNHSNLKNRITMMLQKRTSRWAAAKSLLLLPLVGLAVGAFAETRYLYAEDKDSAKNQISQPAEEGLLKLRLTDEKGAPVVGATVIKAGTGEGICTDPEGRGRLQVKAGDKLVCSMIGKQTISYEVGVVPTEELTLEMATEEVEIDELVVVGYGAKEQTKAAADEEAVPFMLVDDERKKEIMAQHKRDMEQAKAEWEQAKAELEAAKAEMEQAKQEMTTEEVEIDELVVVGYSAQEIEKAKKEIERGKVEFEQAKQEIEAAKQEMEAVKREIEAAKREAEAAKQEMGQAKAEMEAAKQAIEEDGEVFLIVEQMPRFEGGDINTFRRWVQMRVQYPKELQEAGIGGRVVVSFTVEKDGSVSDVQTRRTPDSRLSDRVVKLVKQSPKWEPGKQRGQAVRVSYTIPIEFKITKTEADPQAAKAHEEENTPFLIVEQMPTFQGGDINAFRQWTEAQLKPQRDADGNPLTGMVICSFVIETDGSVSEFTPLRSPDKRLTEEVERVVKLSPRWEAGRQRGQKVRVKFTLPVQFKA